MCPDECNPGISIIIRTNRTDSNPNLATVYKQLTGRTEAIVVGRSIPQPFHGPRTRFRQVKSQVGRFEALKIGVDNADFDSVLFLDDDQVLEDGLLEELKAKSDDAVIIPERSLNRNLVGQLMDFKRVYLEAMASGNSVAEIQVIPRFFKKAILNRAFERLPPETLRVIVQHEDSILYNEARDFCESVSVSNKRIFNVDPDAFSFAVKAYRYGRLNEIAVSSGQLTREQIRFIRKLDRNRVLYDKRLGLNSGIIIDILKGVPYLFGSLSYRLENLFRADEP